MQIQQGNREKKIVKFGEKLLRIKLGKRGKVDSIHNYLLSSGDSIVAITQLINTAANHIINKYQHKKIKEYGELALWLLLNHPELRKICVPLLSTLTKYEINEDDLPDSELTKFETIVLNKVLKYTANEMIKGRYLYIHSDMLHCGNKSIVYINNKILDYIQDLNLKDDELQNAMVIMIECGLWVMQGDTAYRDSFFWSLDKLACDDVKQLIKKNPIRLVKRPYDWYPNVWYRAKQETIRLRAEGKIAPNEFSHAEQMCVPGIQEKLLNGKKR